jgi:hypothetical protein
MRGRAQVERAHGRACEAVKGESKPPTVVSRRSLRDLLDHRMTRSLRDLLDHRMTRSQRDLLDRRWRCYASVATGYWPVTTKTTRLATDTAWSAMRS